MNAPTVHSAAPVCHDRYPSHQQRIQPPRNAGRGGGADSPRPLLILRTAASIEAVAPRR